MKARHVIGLGLLLAAVVLLSACHHKTEFHKRVALVADDPNKVVAIHADDDYPKKCEVDFPITLLRYGKHPNRKRTITWYADDSDYVIFFNGGSPLAGPDGSTPLTTITVTQGNSAGPYQLLNGIKSYYTYEIWRGDTVGSYSGKCQTGVPGYPCLCPQDDQDTGVIVKP